MKEPRGTVISVVLPSSSVIINVTLSSSTLYSMVFPSNSKVPKTVKIFTSFNYDGDKLSVGTVTVYPRSVVKKIEILK